uniref:Coatomer subunit zeta n=1 Tax=Oryzias sinensis TaxID=183150 RepID=A0A8C7YYG0_9TELE
MTVWISADEIAFLEGLTIVYKSSIDLFFYVAGSAQENEVRRALTFSPPRSPHTERTAAAKANVCFYFEILNKVDGFVTLVRNFLLCHPCQLMLMSVLSCLFDSLTHVLRKNVERKCLLENMEGAFLVVDEIIDGGVILESDHQQVLQKVNYRADDNPLTEQSVTQVLQSAKDQIKWSILK